MFNITINYTTKLPELILPPKEVFKKNGNIKRKFYEEHILELHVELVKLQKWLIKNNKKLLIIFEGIDTAGKSSTIKEFNRFLNPRETWIVAFQNLVKLSLPNGIFKDIYNIYQMQKSGYFLIEVGITELELKKYLIFVHKSSMKSFIIKLMM